MYEDAALCAMLRCMNLRSRVVNAWVKHDGHATFKKHGKDDAKVQAGVVPLYKSLYPTIRAIALTKNEASAIEGFLTQFNRWQRAILDSGSNDATVEIAAKHALCVTRPFDDFATQRNAAIDMLGQGADWISMIDPDERITPDLLPLIEKLVTTDEYDVYLLPLRAAYPDGEIKWFVPKPFIFRNLPNMRWHFKVHEKLIGSRKQALITNFSITHDVALHSNEHRANAAAFYDRLAALEPYFTDGAFRAKMKDAWPILDYDRLDDSRITKIYLGPLVSVIIPTYNRPELLKRAIDSVIAQNYRPLECIVIGDNCSQLRTVAESYKNNTTCRFINLPENHGAGGAVPRNIGIYLSNADWIAYLDDDNYYEPDHISHLMERIKADGVRFGFSSMKVNGKPLIFDIPSRGNIDTSCVIHRKELAIERGMWPSRVEAGYTHDWAFFEKLLAGEKYVSSGKPTLVYNADTSGQRDWILSRVS